MAAPLATRLREGLNALVHARFERDHTVFQLRPGRIKRSALKKAQLSLNEAQHRMETLLAELRRQRRVTLRTVEESLAFTVVVENYLGDRGKLRAARIRPGIDEMEIRAVLLEADFEEYYFLPDDASAARLTPVSSPVMEPDLAWQLKRALQLGDAESEYATKYAKVERRIMRALKNKPNLPPDAAQARMDRMIEDLRTSECLHLYDLEQVHAFLEIRKQLDDCGCLRRVTNKCPVEAVALEMLQFLLKNGFEQYFELPSDSSG